MTTNKQLEGDKSKLVIQDSLEMLCCIIAIWAIWPVYMEEKQEVNMMREDASLMGDKSHNMSKKGSDYSENSIKINKLMEDKLLSASSVPGDNHKNHRSLLLR